MENNEIMNNNEEVIETTTEEIVKAASNGGMKKATNAAVEAIGNMSEQVGGKEQIAKVASISAAAEEDGIVKRL